MLGIASALGLAGTGLAFTNATMSASRSNKTAPEPGYLKLHRQGMLAERAQKLRAMMEKCRLCPRECGAKRLTGQRGFCGANADLEISSHNPHFGEERPLVGRGGSGTIFFTHCGLRCVFCINWEISQESTGRPRSAADLAGMMLELQNSGCHNINVVTPTHYSPHIIEALAIAAGKGLSVPLVYNTCGWERLEVLRLLDGAVDIYLPDFKYSEGQMAQRYSRGAAKYPEVTKAALVEMQRQVGTVQLAPDGTVLRGLMIRHLVMPSNASGKKGVLEWVAENLPKNTYVNIMSQYTPVYQANQYPEIARKITRAEYAQAVEWAKKCGLTNLDIQGSPS